MSSITLDTVSKTYPGRRRAVRELDLHVESGELMVLVGPSGCGKTTTLRLIAGLERPDAGEIRIDDRRANRLAPRKRNVAMVFQDFSMYPHLTVRKNMLYALKLRRVARGETASRLARVADLTGVDDLLDRRPGALSGGERQRAALAAALVRQPGCLLLDEPLSNLDAGLRRQLRAELKAIHEASDVTMIHVTHDQEEAMSLGERIAVLHRGRVRQIGTPAELYAHPTDRFVATFLGDPPLNVLDGHLQSENGQLIFRDGHGIELPPPIELNEQLGQPRAREIGYGIRPVDLRLLGGEESAQAVIQAVVTLVEPLGDLMDVHGRLASGASLIARVKVGDHDLAPGLAIRLGFDPQRALLFEAGKAGRRLSDETPD